MKTIYYTFLILLLIASVTEAQVSQQWAVRYNGLSNLNDETSAMTIDASGNTYVTGTTDSIIGFGYKSDQITIKYNPSGSMVWMTKYNGPINGNESGGAITVDNDGNVYVVTSSEGGASDYDVVIIKYNASGVQQWADRLNGSANQLDNGSSIAVDNSGNAYITGYMTRTGSQKDVFAAKYNSAGTQQWIQYYNTFNDLGKEIKLDNSGNVFILCEFQVSANNTDFAIVKYNSSGVFQFASGYNGPANGDDFPGSITIDSAGNVYTCGRCTSLSTGMDGVVIKYDNAGTQLWVKQYSASNTVLFDQFNDVTVDTSGNVYVCGSSEVFAGNPDYLIVKYNNSGVEQWSNRYNVLQNDNALFVSLDAWQNVYITGNIFGLFTSFDILTIKYSSDGTSLWQQIYTPTPNNLDDVKGLAIDNNGSVYLAGKVQNNNATYDMVAIKYDQPIGIEPVSSNIPAGYSLGQNYPNPFNPSTNISIQLPSNGKVQLTIFDITGKKVVELIDRDLPAGEYNINFNAANLTSGVYFYTLHTNNYTETKKMILVK